MKRSFISAGMAAATLVLVWTAAAQDKEQVVRQRQDTMEHMSKLLGTARAFGQGRAEQAAALQSITELRETLKGAGKLFPPGTSMADLPGKSFTRAELWQQQDKVMAAANSTLAEVDKLEAAVRSGDRAASLAQSSATWDQGCQSCHNSFRARKS